MHKQYKIKYKKNVKYTYIWNQHMAVQVIQYAYMTAQHTYKKG